MKTEHQWQKTLPWYIKRACMEENRRRVYASVSLCLEPFRNCILSLHKKH